MNKKIYKILLKYALKAHTFSYKLAGLLAVKLHGGLHPKHKILKYKEWFLGQVQSGQTVLDIGTNNGLLPAMLIDKAAQVYGIEIDARKVAEARKNHTHPALTFIHGDATIFDYTTIDKIDCVILSNVLEHIDDRQAFLKKIATKLNNNQGGHITFLIRVPTIERDWISVYKKMYNHDWKLDRTHYTEHTIEEFKNEIETSGLKLVSMEIKFGEIYAKARS